MTQLWQGQWWVDLEDDKQSWFSKKIKVRGWYSVKGYSGAKNMSEGNYEHVGSPYYFSRAALKPSIGNLSASFGNLSPISERVTDSTQKPPA